MKKKDICLLTQIATTALIGVFGRRHINKKSHQKVRDEAIRKIIGVLAWYDATCTMIDG